MGRIHHLHCSAHGRDLSLPCCVDWGLVSELLISVLLCISGLLSMIWAHRVPSAWVPGTKYLPHGAGSLGTCLQLLSLQVPISAGREQSAGSQQRVDKNPQSVLQSSWVSVTLQWAPQHKTSPLSPVQPQQLYWSALRTGNMCLTPEVSACARPTQGPPPTPHSPRSFRGLHVAPSPAPAGRPPLSRFPMLHRPS